MRRILIDGGVIALSALLIWLAMTPYAWIPLSIILVVYVISSNWGMYQSGCFGEAQISLMISLFISIVTIIVMWLGYASILLAGITLLSTIIYGYHIIDRYRCAD
jgi:hypothetical protein